MRALILISLMVSIVLTQSRYIKFAPSRRHSRHLAQTQDGSDSENKLKEGVINWIKDKVDSDLLQTMYQDHTKEERMCFLVTLQLNESKVYVENDLHSMPSEVVSFVDESCDDVEVSEIKKMYHSLKQYKKKNEDYYKDLWENLPEPIKTPLDRVVEKAKEKTSGKGNEKFAYEVLDALEDILYAPEDDREYLAEKVDIAAPFLTGNLRSQTISTIRVLKKMLKKDVTVLDPEDSAKVVLTLTRWMNAAKIEFLNFFENYEPKNTFPEGVDKQFTEELGELYDLAMRYGKLYFGIMTFVSRMNTNVEEASNEVSIEN